MGFTVMEKVVNGPLQDNPLFVNVGKTVIVAVTGTLEVLVAVKAEMSLLPPAASPMVVLSLVHVKVVP